MTCPLCADLVTGTTMREVLLGVRRLPKLTDLKASATSGCSGCSIICTGVELCYPSPPPQSLDWPDSAVDSVVVYVPAHDAGSSELASLEVRISPFKCVEFFIPRDARICPSWPLIGPASPVPETTGSDTSLHHLETWLNRCRQRHKLCDSGKPNYTPRRVLDLGDLGLPPDVRLHESASGEKLDYLCLSYRWSATPTLQTLKSNIADHKLGIPWECLPLAFQHVCIVARRLRLRYVWIDALCILQDDEHDKALDIALMGSIFEAGVLTIVSAWADGPDRGLFGDLGDFSHREFPAMAPDGVSQAVCVRRQLPHFQDSGEELLPFLKRGWIYQELFLSPRLAFFLENEIVWQCQDHTECQCSPDEPVRVWNPNFNRRSKLRHLNGVQRVFPNKHTLLLADAAAYWWSHVEDYSSCELTNPSDKLPAIQGLVTRLASKLQLGNYLAGMWENSLLFDLAWWVPKRGTRPGTWRAPTWSWASIDGWVNNANYMDEKSWKPLAAITQIRTSPEPKSMTESLRYGRIALDCYIREAWLRIQSPDGPEKWMLGDHLLSLDESDTVHQSTLFYADCDLSPRRPVESMDNFQTTGASVSGTSADDDESVEIWMVLRKAEGDEYERVGLFQGRYHRGLTKEWKRETIHLV